MSTSTRGIENLPTDMILGILSKLDPNGIVKLCKTNDKIRNICKQHKTSLAKIILEKYKVDWTDPGNFIYVVNNVSIYDYKLSGGGWDYVGLYKLYKRWFNEKDIRCSSYDITSFPIYPNMIRFRGFDNQLTSFPIQPAMEKCYIYDNQLESFPVQPNMDEFEGEINNLTTFPSQPRMKICNISDNKLTSFLVQPEMETVFISRNQLTTFPQQPRMRKMVADFNNLSSIAVQPKMILCIVSHNNLTSIPVQPEMKYLNAQFNPIQSISDHPKLKICKVNSIEVPPQGCVNEHFYEDIIEDLEEDEQDESEDEQDETEDERDETEDQMASEDEQDERDETEDERDETEDELDNMASDFLGGEYLISPNPPLANFINSREQKFYEFLTRLKMEGILTNAEQIMITNSSRDLRQQKINFIDLLLEKFPQPYPLDDSNPDRVVITRVYNNVFI